MGILPWKNKQEVQVRRDASATEHPLVQFRQEVDRLFESFFKDPFGSMCNGGMWAEGSSLLPSLDVSETEESFEVSCELPGIDPAQVELSVSGNRLIIQGEKREERENKKADWYHTERRFGSFRRVVELPDGVDTDSLSADFNKGVLQITAKKSLPSTRKQIPIRNQ